LFAAADFIQQRVDYNAQDTSATIRRGRACASTRYVVNPELTIAGIHQHGGVQRVLGVERPAVRFAGAATYRYQSGPDTAAPWPLFPSPPPGIPSAGVKTLYSVNLPEADPWVQLERFGLVSHSAKVFRILESIVLPQ
jgi:hypothetical protein